jgi:transcriptional regulator with XRE-family HTH domain
MEHLAALAALGIKSKRVSELSGVSYPAVVRIAKGKAPRVRTTTADKILAVPLSRDLLRPRARIDAVGARRRLQALIAIGWSRAKLEEKIGIGADHLSRIINGGGARADTIQRITQAYEKLWNTPPVEETRGDRYAARGARREAEEKDWPRPAEWDDDLIDLPDAELAEKLAEMAGEMSNAELWACYQARYREGDRSPLMKAAVTEHHRRRREKRAEAKAS